MKQTVSVPFMLMGILFNVCLIASNLLACKLVQIGSLTVSAALLVFPISYIINDCITEVWGYGKARLIIWTGFMMNLLVVGLGLIAVQLPSPGFWEGKDHFDFVFNLAPRMAVASLLAFLAGSFGNAYVMSKMKVLHSGKYFSFRAITSTLVGETFDSLIFFPIAYWGLIEAKEIFLLMCIEVTIKTLYEIVILPLTIRVVNRVKKIDDCDAYDNNISYNIINLKQL